MMKKKQKKVHQHQQYQYCQKDQTLHTKLKPQAQTSTQANNKHCHRHNKKLLQSSSFPSSPSSKSSGILIQTLNHNSSGNKLRQTASSSQQQLNKQIETLNNKIKRLKDALACQQLNAKVLDQIHRQTVKSMQKEFRKQKAKWFKQIKLLRQKSHINQKLIKQQSRCRCQQPKHHLQNNLKILQPSPSSPSSATQQQFLQTSFVSSTGGVKSQCQSSSFPISPTSHDYLQEMQLEKQKKGNRLLPPLKKSITNTITPTPTLNDVTTQTNNHLNTISLMSIVSQTVKVQLIAIVGQSKDLVRNNINNYNKIEKEDHYQLPIRQLKSYKLPIISIIATTERLNQQQQQQQQLLLQQQQQLKNQQQKQQQQQQHQLLLLLLQQQNLKLKQQIEQLKCQNKNLLQKNVNVEIVQKESDRKTLQYQVQQYSFAQKENKSQSKQKANDDVDGILLSQIDRQDHNHNHNHNNHNNYNINDDKLLLLKISSNQIQVSYIPPPAATHCYPSLSTLLLPSSKSGFLDGQNISEIHMLNSSFQDNYNDKLHGNHKQLTSIVNNNHKQQQQPNWHCHACGAINNQTNQKNHQQQQIKQQQEQNQNQKYQDSPSFLEYQDKVLQSLERQCLQPTHIFNNQNPHENSKVVELSQVKQTLHLTKQVNFRLFDQINKQQKIITEYKLNIKNILEKIRTDHGKTKGKGINQELINKLETLLRIK